MLYSHIALANFSDCSWIPVSKSVRGYAKVSCRKRGTASESLLSFDDQLYIFGTFGDLGKPTLHVTRSFASLPWKPISRFILKCTNSVLTSSKSELQFSRPRRNLSQKTPLQHRGSLRNMLLEVCTSNFEKFDVFNNKSCCFFMHVTPWSRISVETPGLVLQGPLFFPTGAD